MSDLVPFLGAWFWWVVAGGLLILELLAPGVFFVWLAIAAVLVGGIDMVADLGWQTELLLFAVFSVISVMGGWSVLRRRKLLGDDGLHLNQRMLGYVGRTFSLADPIVDGRGRVTIDGTLWEIRGPDSPRGAHMKVTGVDGLLLKVDRA